MRVIKVQMGLQQMLSRTSGFISVRTFRFTQSVRQNYIMLKKEKYKYRRIMLCCCFDDVITNFSDASHVLRIYIFTERNYKTLEQVHHPKIALVSYETESFWSAAKQYGRKERVFFFDSPLNLMKIYLFENTEKGKP